MFKPETLEHILGSPVTPFLVSIDVPKCLSLVRVEDHTCALSRPAPLKVILPRRRRSYDGSKVCRSARLALKYLAVFDGSPSPPPFILLQIITVVGL